MFKIRRLYNQYRNSIWVVILVIVFLIMLLQLINHFVGENLKKVKPSANESVQDKEYTEITILNEKPILSEHTDATIDEISLEVLNEFFAYCNKQELLKAYDLLAEECKEELYPKLKDFEEGYYKKVFGGTKKNISIENWINNIYKIEISEDFLSTGKYDEDNNIQDYITVQKNNNNMYKLNINSYIGRTEINKTNFLDNNIEINVQSKEVYMDYEIYTFNIRNNRNNQILLDNLKEIDSMYLKDKNDLKYLAYTNEIHVKELLINPREVKKVKIKYFNKYGSNKKITNIVFSKIITEYSDKLEEKDYYNFNNYSEINIDL